MNLLRYIGRVKYRMMRLFPYLNIYTAIQVTIATPPELWYVGLLFIAASLGYWFEKTYGIRGELDVAWNSSEVWKKYVEEWRGFKEADRKWKEGIEKLIKECK